MHPPSQQLPGRRLEHRLLPLRTDPQHLRHVDRAGHQHLGPGLRRREPLHGPERQSSRSRSTSAATSSSTTSRARSAPAPRRSTPPTSAATARCRTRGEPGQSLQERARERPEQDEHLGHRRSDQPAAGLPPTSSASRHRRSAGAGRRPKWPPARAPTRRRAAGTRSRRRGPTIRATRRPPGASRSAPVPTRPSTPATGS